MEFETPSPLHASKPPADRPPPPTRPPPTRPPPTRPPPGRFPVARPGAAVAARNEVQMSDLSGYPARSLGKYADGVRKQARRGEASRGSQDARADVRKRPKEQSKQRKWKQRCLSSDYPPAPSFPFPSLLATSCTVRWPPRSPRLVSRRAMRRTGWRGGGLSRVRSRQRRRQKWPNPKIFIDSEKRREKTPSDIRCSRGRPRPTVPPPLSSSSLLLLPILLLRLLLLLCRALCLSRTSAAARGRRCPRCARRPPLRASNGYVVARP